MSTVTTSMEFRSNLQSSTSGNFEISCSRFSLIFGASSSPLLHAGQSSTNDPSRGVPLLGSEGIILVVSMINFELTFSKVDAGSRASLTMPGRIVMSVFGSTLSFRASSRASRSEGSSSVAIMIFKNII